MTAGRLRFGVDLRGTETLNVNGRVVSPGFIDILADNSTSPETTYPIFEKYKVSDGVTTALQMHGGSADCGSYYRRFARLPHSINYGVSTFVMGIRARSGGTRQIEKNLDEGALGVSHSLEYQPAPYAEMLEYAKLAKKYDRPLFLHLRYSSTEKELDGVDEAIRLAKDSGCTCSHRSSSLDWRDVSHGAGAREDPQRKRAGLDDHDLRLSLFLLGHLSFQQPFWRGLATALSVFRTAT